MSKLTDDKRGFFKKLFDGFKNIFKTTKTTKPTYNLSQNSNDRYLEFARKYRSRQREKPKSKSKKSSPRYRSFGKRRRSITRSKIHKKSRVV